MEGWFYCSRKKEHYSHGSMGSEEHRGNYNNLLIHTLGHQPFLILILVGIIAYSTIVPLSRGLSIVFSVFRDFPTPWNSISPSLLSVMQCACRWRNVSPMLHPACTSNFLPSLWFLYKQLTHRNCLPMSIITLSSVPLYLNALIYRDPGVLGGFNFRMRGKNSQIKQGDSNRHLPNHTENNDFEYVYPARFHCFSSFWQANYELTEWGNLSKQVNVCASRALPGFTKKFRAYSGISVVSFSNNI